MAATKFNVPSPQYILNIVIALVIISAIARLIPEQYKQYFRV